MYLSLNVSPLYPSLPSTAEEEADIKRKERAKQQREDFERRLKEDEDRRLAQVKNIEYE